MKKRCLFIFLSSLCSCFAPAQVLPSNTENHFIKYKNITGDFNYLNADMMGNIYVITRSGQLRKLNANGDSLAAYNDVKKYGTPTSIDVSNPLKILVYYKPYAMIVTLDRLLTFRNSINLRSKQLFKVSSIGSSYDNNIWIYDDAELKIKKINDNGDIISEGQELRLVADDMPDTVQLLENEKRVVLYDPEKGFYQFDVLGGYKNTLTLPHWKNVAISDKYIYGFSDNKLQLYEYRSLQLKEYELPGNFNESKDIKAVNGKLYLLKKEGIEIYTID